MCTFFHTISWRMFSCRRVKNIIFFISAFYFFFSNSVRLLLSASTIIWRISALMVLGMWVKEEHVDLHLLSSLLPNTYTLQFPYHSTYLIFQISVLHVFLYVPQCDFWELLELQHKSSPKMNVRVHWCSFEGPSLGSDLFNGRELNSMFVTLEGLISWFIFFPE